MSEPHNPPAVERVLTFLNSRGVGFDAGVDLLAAPESARRLLADLGLPAPADIEGEQLEQLRRLREAMSDALHERGDLAEARAALDAIARTRHFRYRFESDLHVRLEAVDPDAAAQLIEDVAGLIGEAKWERVKSCANARCGAIFYDPTRAKTRRWHAYDICGNKSNVAAFRQRASEGGAS